MRRCPCARAAISLGALVLDIGDAAVRQLEDLHLREQQQTERVMISPGPALSVEISSRVRPEAN